MPHAVEIDTASRTARASSSKASTKASIKTSKSASPKSSSSSRELRQLHAGYSAAREQYLASTLSLTMTRLLESKSRPAVTKIVSLGLGSLKSADQSRRMKQLAILVAIGEHFQLHDPSIKIYAQDPSFTRTDEAFLESLGIAILATPSATEVGEAAGHIDESTLVYCPFLTLEAYQLFFASKSLNFFIGDDFDALRVKWPKHSASRAEADSVWRRFVAQRFQKRAVGAGDDFWEAEEKPFPMAMYWTAPLKPAGKDPKARL